MSAEYRDELDNHVAESMMDPQYAAARTLRGMTVDEALSEAGERLLAAKTDARWMFSPLAACQIVLELRAEISQAGGDPDPDA